MTKNKTKKTIMVSLVAMLICVAMLTGVTYALFQKSVTSANNVITTGIYNVSIQYAETIGGTYNDLPTTAIFSASDKKPGDTIIRYIKLTNSNSYAVNADISIPVLSGNNSLAPYLNVYVDDNASTALDTSGTSAGTLQALAGTSSYAILASVSIPASGTRTVAIGFKVGDIDGSAELTATFDLTVVLSQPNA